MNKDEKYKLYQGDCLEVMDKLIEHGIKVDAIITDPPYGTTACKWDSIIPFNRYIVIKEGKRDKILYKDEFMLRKFKEGINIKEAEKEWKENSKEGMWEKINKLIKPNGAICLFGSEPFSSALRMSNIKNYKYDWYWDKNSSGNILRAKYMPLKVIENICVFSNNGKCNYIPQMRERTEKEKREAAYMLKYKSVTQRSELYEKVNGGFTYTSDPNYKYPINVLYFNARAKECNNQVRLHPTQKPIDLIEYLIKTYTEEEDLVLDFTMGSGSTGVACMNLDRKFIGIELDEKYFNIAKERIENNKLNVEKVITETDTYKKQKKLF